MIQLYIQQPVVRIQCQPIYSKTCALSLCEEIELIGLTSSFLPVITVRDLCDDFLISRKTQTTLCFEWRQLFILLLYIVESLN